MIWHRITEKTKFPKDRTFLLYDEKGSSGLSIYEAMKFEDGSIGCPATMETYGPRDFSHWSELPELPKKDKCPKCRRDW